MFLQILPPESILINKAEIISLAVPLIFLGLFLVYKFVKAKRPKFISESVSVWNFTMAIIKKDLRIN